MTRRVLVAVRVLVVAGIASIALCCSNEPPPAIELRGADIVVQNQTTAGWTGVEIWVNDFWRGLVPSIEAGQRVVVPLDRLVESYGRPFDFHRQPVTGVLVKGRSADGTPIRVTWGKVRKD